MSKPTLCLAFDGVIHSYESGWQGPSKIPDDPVPGALMFLRDALAHFEVSIYSSRSGMPDGIAAMRNWLRRHVEASFSEDEIGWVDQIQWPTMKPPAHVTIDDRALTFTGQWPAFAELLARRYYPIKDDLELERCLAGQCVCESAIECKFDRCKNCDMPAENGKTLTDWCGTGEIFEDRICPDCGAVLDRH